VNDVRSNGPPARAPLSDTRVIDVSRFVAGPLCTFFLASMGAEVIAIEPPAPSPSRRMPPLADPAGGARGDYVEGALSVPFLKRGRGKRSVAIDIRHPDGQDLVRRLVGQGDVFVENSKPGALSAFGLGHDDLRRAFPRLVTCAISGYGQGDTERPAMDVIVQALSGAMAKTGFPDGPPLRSGITIADHATATFAALGIVAALRQRDLTGEGQVVDVAMLDVLTALVFDEPVDHYAATDVPVRTGNADARGAPINSYRCADGWVAVTCTSDVQFERLCGIMGKRELIERFPNMRARAAGARELDAAIEAWTSTRPVLEVEAVLIGIGFPAGRVRDPMEAAQDPSLRERALLEQLRHPDAPADEPSGFLGARIPIVFAGRVDLPSAEVLGASTDAVLRELAGCDDEQLAGLRARQVIG
jgi:crotonobetainyl-CoA:carnitine CoA-transferase CaiB-like acyl-CoA transferase